MSLLRPPVGARVSEITSTLMKLKTLSRQVAPSLDPLVTGVMGQRGRRGWRRQRCGGPGPARVDGNETLSQHLGLRDRRLEETYPPFQTFVRKFGGFGRCFRWLRVSLLS